MKIVNLTTLIFYSREFILTVSPFFSLSMLNDVIRVWEMTSLFLAHMSDDNYFDFVRA